MKYNIPEHVNDLLDESIEKYSTNIISTDDEIWKVAKTYPKLPNFDDIYMMLFFDELIKHLPQSLKYAYKVNGKDTHLYYLDKENKLCELNSLSDIKNIKTLGEHLKAEKIRIEQNVKNVLEYGWMDINDLQYPQDIKRIQYRPNAVDYNYDDSITYYTIYMNDDILENKLSEKELIEFLKNYTKTFI